jgi:RNA polymerase sigma-70 factor (ECF subfamily)
MSSRLEFEALYEEFQHKIHRYMVRMVGEGPADDLTQEIFIKIEKALAGFRGQSRVSTWVYRIATNAALDWLRSRAHRQETHSESLTDPALGGETDLPDLDAGGRPPLAVDDSLVKEEMTECIREFVGELQPDYRAVIVLSELKELPNREIADILGISLDNVKIRLHRARAALKKDLGKGCDFYADEEGDLSCDRKPAE